MSTASDSHRITGSSPDGAADNGGQRAPTAADAPLVAFAHEMRNILGPVRTAAHLLRAGANDDAQAQWALDLIDRQVQAMTALIDELADYSRLARGALELQCHSMDFRDVLDGAASACAVTLNEKRQALEWTRPAAETPVRGDRARLMQAVSAVLRSASGATATGSRISIRVDLLAGEVVTTVGEPPAPPPTGFTAANSDARSAARAETSAPLPKLGLSLAQAIVARHGGALVALDPSRFVIRLPLAVELNRAD